MVCACTKQQIHLRGVAAGTREGKTFVILNKAKRV